MAEISQEEHRLLNTQRFLVVTEHFNFKNGSKAIEVHACVEALPHYEGEPVPPGTVVQIPPPGRPVSRHPPRKEIPESRRSERKSNISISGTEVNDAATKEAEDKGN